MTKKQGDNALTLRLGHEELVIRQRYEVASILNDVVLAVWFIIGSVLFFFESTVIIGTWCFLIGSVQLLIRPVIRLTRRLHLTRVRQGGPSEDHQDF